MSGREVAYKKYVVELSAAEREQLEALISKRRSPARHQLKARILLKADSGDGGEGWSDSRIIEALAGDNIPESVLRIGNGLQG